MMDRHWHPRTRTPHWTDGCNDEYVCGFESDYVQTKANGECFISQESKKTIQEL